jgi:hypothetical protein
MTLGSSNPMEPESPADLAERGARIERLLDDLQTVAGPVAWPRVERLVSALVDLYGSGITRMLACARDTARSSEELEERLTGDELVSGLLLLHGVHPVGLERRVAKALDKVRRDHPNAAELTFVGLESELVVVRITDERPGAQPPSVGVLARAIEAEAPEVTGLRIEGLSSPVPAKGLISASRLIRGGRP